MSVLGTWDGTSSCCRTTYLLTSMSKVGKKVCGNLSNRYLMVPNSGSTNQSWQHSTQSLRTTFCRTGAGCKTSRGGAIETTMARQRVSHCNSKARWLPHGRMLVALSRNPSCPNVVVPSKDACRQESSCYTCSRAGDIVTKRAGDSQPKALHVADIMKMLVNDELRENQCAVIDRPHVQLRKMQMSECTDDLGTLGQGVDRCKRRKIT